MASLENQLENNQQEEIRIREKIDKRNEKRSIQCSGCNELHKIGDLVAIQTHWYTPPSGCTEGDYWNEGELQFVCPETGTINRLLFNNYDVPWEERRIYKNNPESQFKRMYRKLFKEVKDSYDKEILGEWVNNSYIDKNRRKFGLVEKKKHS